MRVLCLGWSDDIVGRAPVEERGYGMAATLFEAATGEAIDWVMKPIIPSYELSAIVDRWLTREQPDAVFVRVNPFFFNYTSLPMKIRARPGPIAARAADLALKVAENRGRSGRGWFKLLRRGSRKVAGGATYFEPDAFVETLRDVMRQIARREGVDILVSGAHVARVADEWMARAPAEHRLARVSEGLSRECRRVGATYQRFAVPLATEELRPLVGFDGIHGNEDFQLFHALLDVRLLLAAWRSREPSGRTLIDVEAPAFPAHDLRSLLPVKASDERWERIARLAGRATVSGPVGAELLKL